MVKIGQWCDVCGACFWAFDDDGEPESQFAEPDGDGVAVDAEDGACECVASDDVDAAWITAAGEEVGDAFEHVDEECAGSAGGVEDAKVGEGVACVWCEVEW